MYPNCFDCPIYRQFCEDRYSGGSAPYGPPIGELLGSPTESPFGPSSEGTYSPPGGSPFFQPATPPGGMTGSENEPITPLQTFTPHKPKVKNYP